MKVHSLIGIGRASRFVLEEVERKNGKRNAIWLGSKDEVAPYLLPLLKRHTATLIKGSRSIGLDEVVESIRNEKK